MAGYVRQSSADIVPTAIVRATPINNEYNALRDAFAQASGHRHDGTAAEGAYVPLISDSNNRNKVVTDSTNNRVGVFISVSSSAVEQVRFQDGAFVPVTDNDIDLGTSSLEFKDLYIDGTANIDSLVADTADINGGTIDATIIGGSTAAAGTFTTLVANTSVTTPALTVNTSAVIASADINAGTIDGTVIGGASAQAITGTTITATTGFVGPLTGAVTGNVTGDLTGNVTGNVTGNLTGNVTASSGSSTFNNVTINGTLNMDASSAATITNITDPTNAQDAATKNYVDTAISNLIDTAPGTLDTLNELAAALGDDPNFATTITNSIATKLALAGGTMSGAIAMGTNKITGLGDPTSNQDAATKVYVDTADATKLSLSGGTMTGAIAMGTNKITGMGDPTSAQDAATKNYIDTLFGSTTSAAASAAAAATSASNAATSASNASTSETNAAASASAAAASYDSFDDRYLGPKSSAPSVDNDGNALLTGALYWNTTNNQLYVWTGSAWSGATFSAGSFLTTSDIGTNVLAYDSNLQSFVTTFTLPTTDGSANQALTTNGSGTLSFGTLGVAGGGTGAATLTANNVILGNGTSAVQFVAPGSNGNVLTSNGTTWTSTTPASNTTLTISNKTGAYTVVSGDAGTVINCTSSGFTISLTAAATLGSGFNCQIWNSASSGNITIDPNGVEPIPFSTTYVLGPGQMATIVCTGSKFNVIAGTISNSVSSVAIGQQVTVNNNNSAAVGYQASAYGSNSAAFGSGANAATDYALAVGYGVQAYSARSSAIGQNSSSAGSVASASGAMSLGGSYASGTDSFAAGIADNTSSYGAKGANSLAIGYQASAASINSVAVGPQSYATGQYSVVIGSNYTGTNTASGTSSCIFGGGGAVASGLYSMCLGAYNTATADYAVSFGPGANSSIKGKLARSNGSFSAFYNLTGDAQAGTLILRSETTNATATRLTSNNSSASSDNQVILPNNSAYAFSALIVARRQASGGTQSAAWKIEGLIRREGSAATTTLVNSATTVLDNTPGWTIAVSADTLYGGLAITATGAASTNIRWVATVQTSEVIYA